ncbi:MAG TPA: undecaprenyl-diphosphate phosphatase [Caulobacteraceae bacterium]|nr:undecaprenyl-diphosphate phosphatase [Caulobacteraceae bacterium]
MLDWLTAILLGVIEGLTEFIPVSSTGHLILAKTLLRLPDVPWDVFIVLIQLGAILAIVVLYFQRLWAVALRLPSDPNARRFALSVILAFLPAGVLGFLFEKKIEGAFENPKLICISLLVGGVVLWIVDRWRPEPRYADAMRYPLGLAAIIGAFQCLSLIPGVSRSGSTIVGALLFRSDRRAAAEFSFFLAIPTMIGAFTLDAWKHRSMINLQYGGLIAVGFIVSFLVGLLVVRVLLDFVSTRGFQPFAWWRIAVGGGGLILLTVLGR